jgi:hypothetical protein
MIAEFGRIYKPMPTTAASDHQHKNLITAQHENLMIAQHKNLMGVASGIVPLGTGMRQ